MQAQFPMLAGRANNPSAGAPARSIAFAWAKLADVWLAVSCLPEAVLFRCIWRRLRPQWSSPGAEVYVMSNITDAFPSPAHIKD